MIADVASEEERAHAMAIMGMVIAMTFAVAMIAGPLLAGFLGVPSLFWLTGILAATALLILFSSVPEPPRIVHTYSEEKVRIKHVFQDKDLVRMYITFLFHSSTMTIAFFIIPILLKHKFHIDPTGFWKVYLPAVIFGVIAMGPAAVFGEKYSKGKEIFLLSIFFIVVSFFLMGFTNSFLLFGIGATFFFIGFNMFEPLLQSFVAKFAKVHQKGTALGVANTFAYIGVFLGGVFGGYIYQHFQEKGVAIFVFIVAIFWTWWIISMKNPGNRKTAYIELNDETRAKIHDIKKANGITDQYINETEAVIVIKYDAQKTDEEFVKKFFKD
jgi:predicted MFS family arabinose efflux permease